MELIIATDRRTHCRSVNDKQSISIKKSQILVTFVYAWP